MAGRWIDLKKATAKRNSPNDFQEIDDLNRLDEIVVDKRNSKRRASAKKSRRNCHYDKQFIKGVLKDHLTGNDGA